MATDAAGSIGSRSTAFCSRRVRVIVIVREFPCSAFNVVIGGRRWMPCSSFYRLEIDCFLFAARFRVIVIVREFCVFCV
jgi:hypothetical protein